MMVANAAAVALAVIVTALRPDPIVTVSKWAEQKRVVAQEASAIHYGRWSNDLAPYLVEPMDCLSLSDPCNEVVVKKSAQLGFTEAGLNMFGTIVDRTPTPMLIVLPTVDTSRVWVKTKLEPAITATPALRFKVRPMMRGRDGAGSTGSMKRYPGGFSIITGANSSADLQSWSVRAVILEEVSEYPLDVDQRGDPVDLALARTKGVHEFRKIYYNSTPGLKGACRISKLYEASDQRRYFVPCPQCGDYHVLKFENMRFAETPPHNPHFVCPGCGGVIEERQKRAMIAAGVWLKTFPAATKADGDETAEASAPDDDAPPMMVPVAEIDRYRARSSAGRNPGFAIWQAYSPFVPWTGTVERFVASRGDPTKEKVFVQQDLGEDFEETGEQPDWQKLRGRLERYPLRIMPEGCLFCTGAADVQGNRIEWAIYGWGIGKTSWLLDKGVIEGDTTGVATFAPLSEIVMRPVETVHGNSFALDAFAIDANFNTQTVYAWVRRMGPNVIAVRGAAGASANHWFPPLGTPKQQEVNYQGQRAKRGVMLWPVGTWQIKSDFYANLRKTIAGPNEDGTFPPGYVHLPADLDDDYLKQLTAEYLDTREVGRLIVKEWVNPPGRRNEALDIRVYAYAAAVHVGMDKMTPDQWLQLAALRGADAAKAQMDLQLWSAGLVGPAPLPAAAPEGVAPAPASEPASSNTDRDRERWVQSDCNSWIEERKEWL
jgi:phage terminase large subunit GpA-like protein